MLQNRVFCCAWSWLGSGHTHSRIFINTYIHHISRTQSREPVKRRIHTTLNTPRQVFCRLLEESPSHAASNFPASKLAQLNVGKADSSHDAPSQKFGSVVEGSGVMGGLGYVHPSMLALAVRACRRHLLEISGWHDEKSGHKEGHRAFPEYVEINARS